MQTTKKATSKLVREIIKASEDYEFYPTTPEIIACVKQDLRTIFRVGESSLITQSILDCGAGDGRVLMALTHGTKYAIEKSTPLINVMPKEVFIIGSDFHQQQLIDKRVSVIYSNPPYSEFDVWLIKIITEANAKVFYAVIPERWSDNSSIQQAMDARKVKATKLGDFSFLDADRVARGTVNLVRFDFVRLTDGQVGYNSNAKIDPFGLWFDTHFKLNANKGYHSKLSEYGAKKEARENLARHYDSTALVDQSCPVQMLEDFYNRDITRLMNTYKALSSIDASLLIELDIKIDNVKEALELKIKSLKDVYWNKVFNKLTVITTKLTTASRKTLLDKLLENTDVDFTVQNVHAIIVWVVKNANTYFDSQLISVFEKLTEQANVINYKSNQRTFGDECWRYNKMFVEGSATHYKLDYRVVLESVGGIAGSGANIVMAAQNLINDLCTIASNIGFDTSNINSVSDMRWYSNNKNQFEFFNHTMDERQLLFQVKCFKNGNMHIQFLPEFICKLNVEHGRLKGWLKSKEEASSELDIDIAIVESAFESNFKLLPDISLKLLAA
ncbi:DUF4942 domain-containing protein [Shewanella sp. BF02_Schw]|uniref:class I SAM-dependent methyltransferase n=1 Tax=Shewanella sp. BF02_Schw TaxID=394908 RepID=UPI00178775DA|nr:DUF4942 domain-containing protein [Shewanella sp. BF02_Schw]MBO1897540.1 DUF4942 domain-containing protein [Shewanella sp. BF02_Schw]